MAARGAALRELMEAPLSLAVPGHQVRDTQGVVSDRVADKQIQAAQVAVVPVLPLFLVLLPIQLVVTRALTDLRQVFWGQATILAVVVVRGRIILLLEGMVVLAAAAVGLRLLAVEDQVADRR